MVDGRDGGDVVESDRFMRRDIICAVGSRILDLGILHIPGQELPNV